MRMDVITLFPAMIEAFFQEGVSARGWHHEHFSLHCWNPRHYSDDPNGRVDDRPYGGGPGMLMRYQPLADTLSAIPRSPEAPLIYLSPRGEPLKQNLLQRLSRLPQILLLCGRYEGIDQRFIDQHVSFELSLGDFVLSGGEIAAAAVIDGIARLLPEVLHTAESTQEESFSAGLLEYPHYTRPEIIDNIRAPEILLSGNHQAIRRWRLKQALGGTFLQRPELIGQLNLSSEHHTLLQEFLHDLSGDMS